jgi:hypothetical protein
MTPGKERGPAADRTSPNTNPTACYPNRLLTPSIVAENDLRAFGRLNRWWLREVARMHRDRTNCTCNACSRRCA